MYILRRFDQERYARLNAIRDALAAHIEGWVNLIGSSTLPLPEVLLGSSFPATACRVEGYPDKRLFPASDPMDLAEQLIIERTSALFSLPDNYLVNGQPHSATQANQAIYASTPPGVVFALSPSSGGHVSHSVALPQHLQFQPIPINEHGIQYSELRDLVFAQKPVLIIGGATSYPFGIDYEKLRAIADMVEARLHGDLAHSSPYIATGLHPPAFPSVDSAVIDTGKSLRGPRGAILIYKRDFAKEIERGLFPLTQTSPNQTGLIAKAVCLEYWHKAGLRPYAERLIESAQLLGSALENSGANIFFRRTETHLLLLEVTPFDLTGVQAEILLSKHRILVNRNQVLGDSRNPWVGSGIRMGTTAVTILDYTDNDIEMLGQIIARLLLAGPSTQVLATVHELLHRKHGALINSANE